MKQTIKEWLGLAAWIGGSLVLVCGTIWMFAYAQSVNGAGF